MRTTFRYGGCGAALSYCEHEQDAQLRDQSGRPMSESRKQQMIDRSQSEQFERHMVLSPDPSEVDMDRDGMSEATRETMNEWAEDKDVEYAYAVHQDSGNQKHAHVVAVGDKSDLYMEQPEIDHVEEIGQEQFRAVQKQRSQDLEEDLINEVGLDQQQDHSRGVAR
jgi:hypothetical protein